MIQISLHLPRGKQTSIIIHMSSRNTRRHHHIHIRRCLLRLIQNIINSIRTRYIRRFMRINNKCSSSTLRRLTYQLSRCHQSGLQMQMTVNKSRTDHLPIQINLRLPLICTNTNHNPIRDSHITIDKLTRTRTEHTPILKHQLRLLKTSRHLRILPINLQFHKNPSLLKPYRTPCTHESLYIFRLSLLMLAFFLYISLYIIICHFNMQLIFPAHFSFLVF